MNVAQRSVGLPLQIVSADVQHVIGDHFRVLLYFCDHIPTQISCHRQKALDRSFTAVEIFISSTVLYLSIVDLHDKFEVGLILMLSPQPSQKLIEHGIVEGD